MYFLLNANVFGVDIQVTKEDMHEKLTHPIWFFAVTLTALVSRYAKAFSGLT
jgi:hypothetical protein